MKHLNIIEAEKKPKTQVYDIFSSHDETLLGRIYWYPSWRQYVFQPIIDIETIWSDDCLEELYDFIHNLKLVRKK